MFDAKLNYESRFFIFGKELPGVESIGLSYANQAGIIKPLGSKKGIAINNAEQQKSLSISRSLLYQDPLLNCTGSNPTTANIYYNGDLYGFGSGYMTEYLVNCAVGAIPRVTTNFFIADNLEKNANPLYSIDIPNVYIPSQGSISIISDNTSSNRVVGFDYSIKMNRKPIYTIGSIYPAVVESILPLEYSASVQIEIDDAFMETSSNFLTKKQNKTISISIKGRNGEEIQSLSIPKASLVSEQLSASADGILKLTLNYIGHS